MGTTSRTRLPLLPTRAVAGEAVAGKAVGSGSTVCGRLGGCWFKCIPSTGTQLR